MSVDFTKPIATADRAQNLTDTKDTLVAVAKQLDDTTPTGVAAGMIRWSTTNNKWQKYNGTSWVDLAATFSMNVSSLGGQAAASYLLKSGGTLTGFLTLHAAPTADQHPATKAYVDTRPVKNIAGGYNSGIQTSGTVLVCTDEVVDTASAFNHTTGEFTAPDAGTYLVMVSASIVNAGGSSALARLRVRKNTVQQAQQFTSHVETTRTAHLSGQVLVQCSAGDVLDVSHYVAFSAVSLFATYANLTFMRLA